LIYLEFGLHALGSKRVYTPRDLVDLTCVLNTPFIKVKLDMTA
jgi:hypothetical protein